MIELVDRVPKIFKGIDSPFRYKIMWGGRGSGKSWSVARKLLVRGVDNPIKVLCTRELQKSIKQSVHALLVVQIRELGLGGFYSVTNDTIRGINGTEFIFIGVRMNSDEIRSLEGVDICWIEEAHAITPASWEVIDPTIRR